MVKYIKQLRSGLPQVGVKPYGQVHAHSTGNRNSTAQNEADYHDRRPVNSGFFSHVVGNGKIIQTARVNAGFYDVGGGWNSWGYAAVELIESHKTKEEFMIDYRIYVDLLRSLAKEAGLPIKLDSGNTGIITHDYARKHQPNNGTDHVDPYPYLARWGISKEQFKKDIEHGMGGTVASKPSTTFNINNYHTKNYPRIKVIKEDFVYKEVGLKTRVEKVKKGTVLTVVDIQYSGKYPRYKLKSGLYITTRKDTVEEYKTVSKDARVFDNGQKVKVRAKATRYQTGEQIPNWVHGMTYKVKARKKVNQSNSEYAYLLDGINSWFLVQDLDKV